MLQNILETSLHAIKDSWNIFICLPFNLRRLIIIIIIIWTQCHKPETSERGPACFKSLRLTAQVWNKHMWSWIRPAHACRLAPWFWDQPMWSCKHQDCEHANVPLIYNSCAKQTSFLLELNFLIGTRAWHVRQWSLRPWLIKVNKDPG